jgi:acyl-CoA thioester hydrolase
MANTAYLDYSVDTRMAYFASQGFASIEFQRQQFGPVIKTDTVEYFREVRLMETFKVAFQASGLADNASRFRIVNTFFLEDGTLSARVTTVGGWLSFTSRKLIIPPEIIRNAMHNLDKTDDFEVFKASVT